MLHEFAYWDFPDGVKQAERRPYSKTSLIAEPYMFTGRQTSRWNASPHQSYASPPPTEREGQFKTSPTFVSADADGTRPPTISVVISRDLVLFHVDEAPSTDKSNDSFKDILLLASENSSRSLFLADILSAELEIVLQAVYAVVESNIPPSIMEIKTLIGFRSASH
ncbi:hypothetical protein PQX77_015583 [Marasmius sp. AFHP31]|nr:hypothetical protein PQX77_015583 [Marasmius sp. AFHP31]